MEKTNLVVGENNCLGISGGKELVVRLFRSQEFCKCIGCILSAVNYGNKVHKLWGGGGVQYILVRS